TPTCPTDSVLALKVIDSSIVSVSPDIGREGLTRRAERAEAGLAKMQRVVEIQGNVSALLEEMLGQGSAQKSTER
ncbi:MAG: hypothetical protein ACRDLT_13520, partial [Solirubrobacteraceae bacterium]